MDHDKKAADDSAAASASSASSSSSSSSTFDLSSSSLSSYSDNGGGSGSDSARTGSTGAIGKFINSPAGTATVISLSALAASVAIGAILMFSRRKHNSGERHALHGMIKRRIGMFQTLASRTKCATCRPERLSDAVDDSTDYRLA